MEDTDIIDGLLSNNEQRAYFKELVIDEQGDIVPIAHGCSKHFKIGNIYGNVSCRQMIEHFMQEKIDDIMDLYQTTCNSIVNDKENELVNWSEIIIRFSHQLFDTPLTPLYLK